MATFALRANIIPGCMTSWETTIATARPKLSQLKLLYEDIEKVTTDQNNFLQSRGHDYLGSWFELQSSMIDGTIKQFIFQVQLGRRLYYDELRDSFPPIFMY
jgi:hypothetical protein